MSNKSKAQQYADYNKIVVPVRPEFGDTAYVYQDGDLYLATAKLSPEGALALRDWLTDTFDVPKAVTSSDTAWTQDIKPDFVGRTRDGRKATYKGSCLGEKAFIFYWSIGNSKYIYQTLISRCKGRESDWDIIGPWEGDNK